MKKQLLLLLALLPYVAISQITEIADVNPGAADASPSTFYVDSSNRILFQANDGTNGNELFIYNGSTASLIDINTTELDANSNPNNFTEFGGKIYFRAFDGINGTELWETDGTIANTTLVADINVGGSSNPNPIFVLGNELFFTALDGSSTQIWKLNGSTPIKFTNNNSGGFAGHAYPQAANSGLYMRMNDGNGNEPAFFDGTGDATEILDIRTGSGPGMLVSTDEKNILVLNDKLFFEADPDDGTGDEIWVSDATAAGTFMLKETNPGSDNGDPDYFEVYKGELFFASKDADGYQLWKTDGTTVGTLLVSNPNPTGDGGVSDLFSDGSILYFAASNGTDGVELWSFNGTTATMLKDINTGGDSSPFGFASLGGNVFFSADDGTGNKLWLTDGTSAGTVSVASKFTTSADPTDVDEITIWDNKLVFSATGANGNELYSFDPTTLSVPTVDLISLKMYPNPATDYLMFSEGFQGSTYTIYDIMGKSLQNGVLNSNKINLTLNSGLYLIKLETNGTQMTKKIMVK